jgi:uncharacterized protein (DUF934 family)
MPLIKHRHIVVDTWQQIDDDAPIPPDGGAIVSLDRWLAERDTLIGRNAPLGVRLNSSQSPQAIAEDLGRLALVALDFPHFKDGRAYSSARLLRERHHFTGEVRAVGNVLRDQLAFMARCGFDAFEYVGRTAAEEALKAFNEVDVVYQTAADRRRSAASQRNDISDVFMNGTCG